MTNINKLRENILDFIYVNKYNRYTKASLIKILQINNKDIKYVNLVYKNLLDEQLIIKTKNKIKANLIYNIGYLQSFNKKEHYVFFNKNKYKVDIDNISNAIHGDKVIFKIIDPYIFTAKIISIIKRKQVKISGTYVTYNSIPFCVPDYSDKYNLDIYINKNDICAKPYDRVLIKIDSYKIKGKPEGSIERILYDNINEKGESILDNVIYKYKIDNDFPGEVLSKAQILDKPLNKNMILYRTDFRDKKIFTIDGINAKDLDDAISIEKIDNKYELGVYIADVSYYVKENGAIDREAFKRGNSYYLQDYVIPMLPQAISNRICSLNEGKDRICIGIIMIIDQNGTVLNCDLCECVINSKKRFTYEEINDYLDNKNKNLINEVPNLINNLKLGLELAEILKNKREKNGSLNFNFEDIKFIKDQNNNIINVIPDKKGLANNMIEEFMICANENIAKTIYNTNHPFIYRVHGEPFDDRIQNFLNICKNKNIDISYIDNNEYNSKSFQKLLMSIKDKNLKKCLQMNFITTMKQAKYSNVHNNHFALSLNDYCHFTSPIRRYTDLFNHRIVKKYIRKTLNNDVTKGLYQKLSEKVSNHCCYTERNADKAEEELDKLILVEYLNNNPDKVFTGIIYSINKRGLCILIKDIIAGVVNINGDFDENENCLYYKNNTYCIGDKINVYFKYYDVKYGRILFEFNN